MEIKSGYKQTKLGVLPKDWIITSVGEVAEVKTGPFGSALHEKDYVKYGTPIITVEHLGERGILHTNPPMVSETDRIRLKAYSLQQGDIVFSRVGSIDRNALIKTTESGWLFSGRLLRIRLKKSDIDAQYLSYHFHSHDFKRRIREVAVGQTMASINTQILMGIAVIIPSDVTEQKFIAQTLKDADAYIESLEQLIAKKRLIKQGAINKLLKPKNDWIAVRLGELASFYKGKGLSKSAINLSSQEPCIHYGELFTRYPESIKSVISRTNAQKNAVCSIKNDVVMPTSDVTPSGLAIASCILQDNVILGGDILIIRAPAEKLNGSFLSYIIRNSREQVLKLVSGTTVYHLYSGDMKQFTFSMPKIDDQIAIVKLLDDMETEIIALESKLTKARRLKQGMMQELLTGRIRLI